MRITVAVAAAIVAVGLTACSAEDKDNAQNKINEAVTGGQQAVESAQETAGDLVGQGKVAMFVATYRGGFPVFAENRQDGDIEEILITTCEGVAQGTDEAAIKAKITELATNGSSTPTEKDATYIYQLAKASCP